jgi:tetratricopeptide (TPR) repeat protein
MSVTPRARKLGATTRTIIVIVVVTAAAAIAVYNYGDLLPARLTRYFAAIKWGCVLGAGILAVLSAIYSIKNRSDTAGRIALAAAVVGALGMSLDVPVKVDSKEYKALMERNAYPDLDPSERIRKIAERIDRTELDPLRLAQGKLALEEYREAIGLLDRVVQDMEPAVSSLAMASFYKASAFFQMNNYEGAIRELDRALQLRPNYLDALVLRCTVLRRLDRLSEAMKSCEAAIDVDRRSALAWNNLGTVLYILDKDREALAAFNIAIQCDPRDPRPWSNKAYVMWDFGRLGDALTAAEMSLKLSPGFLPPLMAKASLLRELRRYSQADLVYRQIISVNQDDAEIWMNYGNLLFDMGRHEAALEKFLVAIQLRPECQNGYYNMGDKLIELGRFSEAVVYLEKAVQMKPRDFDAWERLGDSYKGLKRTQDAERAFQRAREINPDYETAESTAGYEC